MNRKKDEEPAREGGAFDNAGSVVIFPVPPRLLKHWREHAAKEKAKRERELQEKEKDEEAGEEGADE